MYRYVDYAGYPAGRKFPISMTALSVRRRVEFKIASLVHEVLSSQAPACSPPVWPPPAISISSQKVLFAPSGCLFLFIYEFTVVQ